MDVRRFAVPILVLLCLVSAGACAQKKAPPDLQVQSSKSCQPAAIQNQFIVKWNDGTISTHRAKNVDTFLKEFVEKNADNMAYFENDYEIRSVAQPATSNTLTPVESGPWKTESVFSSSQDINWGSTRINAEAAWNLGARGADVIVAIIDSPIDLHNPQIFPHIAVNTKETANGLDDDHNGLVDDIYGYDFARKEPQDQFTTNNFHGTFVSGIIVADPAFGVIKGIAPEAKLLPLAFIRDDTKGAVSDAIPAFKYAASRGAKVINASWGGANCSYALYETMSELEAQDILIVIAAGNEGRNLEEAPEFPAAFQFPHALTVGASGYLDYTFDHSNFSTKLVHLVAPGVNVGSTSLGNTVAEKTGTSFSAPYVAATAAVLRGRRPQATMLQIRQAILEGVDKNDYPVESQGRLNVGKALAALDRLLNI